MIDQAQVREALARLRRSDGELSQELQGKLEASRREVVFETMTESAPGAVGQRLTQETIVLRSGRPVLAIANDQARLVFQDEDSAVWRNRLTAAQPILTPGIRAVGRVEVEGHDLDWIGTGWLVAPDIIVTNRHVAQEFGISSGTGFVFRRGFLGFPMTASLDFLEELGSSAQRVAKVASILHIEGEDGPDIAFLRLRATANLAAPILLEEGRAQANQRVAVIGYPARDSRLPDQELMERLFGNVYDKKRLAPGEVQPASTAASLQHDCSTLGGNSGSVVLDLASGKAVGLHFAGRFLRANFAVPATVIAERLHAVVRGEARPRTISVPPPPVTGGPALQSPSPAGAAAEFTCTIPIHLTISVGAPQAGAVAPAATVAPPPPPPPDSDADTGDSDEFAPEGVVSDYLDREGYVPDFLGSAAPEIPLPAIVENADQIVTFNFEGNPSESILKYEHFSVVMRRDRRLCFYSAVNIDGTQPKKQKRTGWTTDPRIPTALQIRNECYGDPPKFSRGHMTRREDPVWGSPEAAKRGNSDSMHVTNAVPQMQSFNGGIWLRLENYALDHTKDDEMRVSVFTGPVFTANDPVRHGIKIPVLFWKVLAFIHDETGELSATGYTMSQAKFLSESEFVFGTYETHQRSLSSIEAMTGLSFGPLTAVDLFDDSTESAGRPLTHPGQIRFTRNR